MVTQYQAVIVFKNATSKLKNYPGLSQIRSIRSVYDLNLTFTGSGFVTEDHESSGLLDLENSLSISGTR